MHPLLTEMQRGTWALGRGTGYHIHALHGCLRRGTPIEKWYILFNRNIITDVTEDGSVPTPVVDGGSVWGSLVFYDAAKRANVRRANEY